jgi:SAM-dependent methyltransferase
MHDSSLVLMSRFLKMLPDTPLNILDVGSYDVNGSYKNLIKNPKWKYVGLDMSPGPNVDIVAPPETPFPIPDSSFDVVISGQCFEHCEAPWLLIKEVERVCKPGGMIAIIAPWNFPIHRYPVDCWRILPDGMTYLLTKWCKFSMIECGTAPINNVSGDCYGFARKL